MEKIVYLFLFCLPLCTSASETNYWLEPQIALSKEKSISRIDGGLNGSITDTIGYYAYGQAISNGFRQAYGGPNWKPVQWLEVGAGLGGEDSSLVIRRNVYFQATIEKVSIFGTFEQGGSGAYHKVIATYQLPKRIRVGLMEETFLGRGLRVEYSINNNTSIWGARLWDRWSDTWNSVVAVSYGF